VSLFQELKRRNVFRVGIAYGVAAWVLLQLTDVLGEILELPEWGGKLILLLLVVGFIPALILAWAFELTPEGVKRESEVDRSQSVAPRTGKKLNGVILVLMTIGISYLLIDKFYISRHVFPPSAAIEATQENAQPETEPVAKPAVDSQSIAVLPFENRSRLEEDAFFVEGIHDDLLTNLARIGSLKVISRTSVNKYKETEKTIPEIAGELGVATVMEGAVQRSGNTVRINVQLIDANNDQHLWAEIFDRELTADNLFAIQSEISEKIASALQATLSPEEQERLNERPTQNLAAYDAYLRGRQLMARRNSQDLDQAAHEFERAVELDPEFALAWVSIAEVSSLQLSYSSLGLLESIERRRMATERALAIDDQLGEAYLGLAGLHAYNEQYDDADAAYQKAIELSPGYAIAYLWYSGFLSDYPHRLDEALETLQKAIELDPMSSIIQLELADLYALLGRYSEAEQQLNKVLNMDPDFAPAYVAMADLMSDRGRFDEQVHWLQKSIALDPGRIMQFMPLLWAYMDLGYPEGLEPIKQQMAQISDEHVLLGWVDMISSMYLGNFEASLEAATWTFEKMGRRPMFKGFFALIHSMQGNYAEARKALEIAGPQFFDRARWRAAIEDEPEKGCFAGWLMLRTGDEEMGQSLISTSINYLENELPGYIAHADRYNGSSCYAAIGDYEKAMNVFEMRVDHKHYSGWWFLRMQPQFEPLWGTPRFEAAMQKIENDLAIQRANLARMDTAANF
jgi:TolB-like protein/Tfp pilus assembly protein PilF